MADGFLICYQLICNVYYLVRLLLYRVHHITNNLHNILDLELESINSRASLTIFMSYTCMQ